MAQIKPFCGIRPRRDLAERIAALPYDVYSRGEARKEVEREPLSFLKIDRAETQFPPGTDIYAACVYEKARDTLAQMLRGGEFVRDGTACYYLYEQNMAGHCQTGIVGCAAIDDYIDQTIKKHENTREEKERDRFRHIDICGMQTGPIFLAYRANAALKALVAEAKMAEPETAFCSPDGVGHRIWVIRDGERIEKIRGLFAAIDSIYIADGHHRAASAVKVGLKRRREDPGYDGSEPFNYFLSVLFPDDELRILDYNRVILDTGKLRDGELQERLTEKFVVEGPFLQAVHPSGKGEFGLYDTSGWYRLSVLPQYMSDDPVAGLDVSILQREVLEPIYHIEDPRTDPRIDFVGGIRGLEELERRVHRDAKAAFALYPTSIGELFAVADAGRLMPPKSTWFEPKLR
ncbi:MAG TPA: DUF1015 domain-containing protein, partial [Lachnospiraceae bacterium]|nr:DUF1015 domain-containing protein [Lachnospiraceae bacterium]